MSSEVSLFNLVLIAFFRDASCYELFKLSKTAEYQKVVKNKQFLINII